MKKISKALTGAAAAALVTTGFAAAPAEAQRYRTYDHRYYDRDRGIDAGDVIAGVAIIGGIAAIAAALDRDGYRYGYGNRYRYRDNYRDAVNRCGYEAERYGRGGRVSVTDVDRRGSGFRVRGVVDSYGGYDRFGRSDRYGYDRYDRYGRYGRYDARVAFTCYTDRYGRVRDFDVNRYRW
jgi:hypothetical protein